jgi:hypothetical protein
VLWVLRSVGDISPIGAFLVMRLQWIIHNAFNTLSAKAAFAKLFNLSQTKDRWSTTSLNATGDTRQDMALLCATLTEDPSHPAWYRPISLLTPVHTHRKGGLMPDTKALVAIPSNGTLHGASTAHKWLPRVST